MLRFSKRILHLSAFAVKNEENILALYDYGLVAGCMSFPWFELHYL
jgi:hypothetical protein